LFGLQQHGYNADLVAGHHSQHVGFGLPSSFASQITSSYTGMQVAQLRSLSSCVWMQVSFEAPPGVKRNLQRTFEAWGPAFISRAAPLQAQLLFMLAWFHAIVQERRTYMPQASPFSHVGW